MQYVMKAGMLYDRNLKKVFARMKREFAGRERRILSADGALVLHTNIRRLQESGRQGRETAQTESGRGTRGDDTGEAFHGADGDVRLLEYVLEDEAGHTYATARPDYAEGEAPEEGGWPLCRMPKVDHARLRMDGREYDLIMKDSASYTMSEPSGRVVLRVLHKGLAGGWDIEALDRLMPETVCGLFAFCRYMEQENEFVAL